MTDTNPFELKEKGDAEFAKGNTELALACYDKALALRPQFHAAASQKGEVLLSTGKSLEAANMFWQAYLFSQMNTEIGLKAAKALTYANFYLEASSVFSTINKENFDDDSLALYIYSLRQQGLTQEALTLIPQLEKSHSLLIDWAKALIFLDLNKVTKALELLKPWEDEDKEGHIATLLHATYIALNDKISLRKMLDKAIERVNCPDYFCCQRIALDVLDGLNKTPLNTYRTLKRLDLIDAAHYLRKNADKKLIQTGTTYQTFDILAPQIPEQGLILEFGVRFGYSTSHLAKLFPQRTIFGFDSFQGLPEAWHHEMAGSYSTQGKIPKLAKNIKLIAGWFNETLPDFKKDHSEPIAFINIDCDLYSSTKLVFEELNTQIIPGTIIVFDEYIGNINWREDEFKAFQEWTKKYHVTYRYLTSSFYTKQVSVQIMQKK